VSCLEVAAALPGILDGASTAPAPLVGHVETCLGCQAELARYRKLVRLLHQLRSSEVEPPAGLVGEVLGALEEAANRRVIRSVLTGRRLMYGGAVAAAGGAAVGLVVLARAHAGAGTRAGTAHEGAS